MKLKKGFITHQLGEEQLMVAAGPAAKLFHGIARSNETAALIVNCLKKDTTTEAIVARILEEYEADEDTVRQDVEAILEKLRAINAIE